MEYLHNNSKEYQLDYQLDAQSDEKSATSNLSLPYLLTRVKNTRKRRKGFSKHKSRELKPRYLSNIQGKNTEGIKNSGLLNVTGNSVRIYNPNDPETKFKGSTRKLIKLIEDIQAKFVSRKLFVEESEIKKELVTGTADILMLREEQSVITDPIVVLALKNVSDCVFKELTLDSKEGDGVVTRNEPDTCSIYQRLTKKCVCLNRKEFNDFIIHFNEDTRRFANPLGEIIKNMRVLKRFLYMGNEYTRNALIFINEGLCHSSHGQKLEIIQGCCFADLCNVFEGDSLIKECIEAPFEHNDFGDTVIQYLAARFISSLAGCEEGRRYLNFCPKIIHDIDGILKQRGRKLDCQCADLLTRALCVLSQCLKERSAMAYSCKHFEEGSGQEIIRYLKEYRDRMTTDEIYIHLNLLHNFTSKEHEQLNIFRNLPKILTIFKEMLVQYDDSEMNMIIINILNNIVTRNIVNQSTTPPIRSYGVLFPEMQQQGQLEKNTIGYTKIIEKVRKHPNKCIVEILRKEAGKHMTKSKLKNYNDIVVPSKLNSIF